MRCADQIHLTQWELIAERPGRDIVEADTLAVLQPAR
jgi:hypothetical protein